MYKLSYKNCIFPIFLSGLVAINAAHASFLFPSASDKLKQNSNNPTPNKALSPDEFRSRVNTISQQNQNQLNNQVQQLLAKQPKPAPLPPPPSSVTKNPEKTNSAAASAPGESSEENADNSQQENQSSESSENDSLPPTTAPQQTSGSSSTTNTQNQNYSGFIGSGSSTNKSGTSGSKSNSGSLGIKY